MDRLATVLSPHKTSKSKAGAERAVADTDPIKRRQNEIVREKMSGPEARSRSPVKYAASNSLSSRARSKSPVKFHGNPARGREFTRDRSELIGDTTVPADIAVGTSIWGPCLESPRARNQSPSIAERRLQHAPTPIDVDAARSHARRVKPRAAAAVIVQSTCRLPASTRPKTPEAFPLGLDPGSATDDASSIYSQEEKGDHCGESLPHISPLHIRKAVGPALPQQSNVLQSYNQWRNGKVSPKRPTEAPSRSQSARLPVRLTARGNIEKAEGWLETVYSPLTPFFSTKDLPASTKVSKTLIGDNGWLERTGKSPEKAAPSPKKAGFLDNLKKKAKEMVDMADLMTTYRSRDSDKDRPGSHLTISVDPREQSLLYCEMEFILTSAIDGYITAQFNAGRLDADKLKKISDMWQQRGRPKVVGFRYDLETQLDLIRLHTMDFKFNGRHSTIANVNGIVDMMRVNARAMRIRTFCQPDTVIAKQLLDSQNLFNTLGCPEQQQIQLAEVVQFFKTILERERHFAAKRARKSASTTLAFSHPGGN